MKKTQLKREHQWTVVTLANAFIQTPECPVLSIGSCTQRQQSLLKTNILPGGTYLMGPYT